MVEIKQSHFSEVEEIERQIQDSNLNSELGLQGQEILKKSDIIESAGYKIITKKQLEDILGVTKFNKKAMRGQGQEVRYQEINTTRLRIPYGAKLKIKDVIDQEFFKLEDIFIAYPATRKHYYSDPAIIGRFDDNEYLIFWWDYKYGGSNV